MVFFETETVIALTIASTPGIWSIYCFLVKQQFQQGLFWLLCSAFLLRLTMICLDPYLHEWDERYHALVAKNVMQTPFTPRLFPVHIIPFDLHDWGYNYIWVHKQPVFLWQMALSMKIFGANLFGLRLPSAIMGTVMVWLTYDIGKRWTMNNEIGFVAAFFIAFGSYGLELVSGRLSLDHNDLAFAFYITASFWAFIRFVQAETKWRWALLVGVFAGLAIMNKWLTGLIVFSGWFLYFLLSTRKEKFSMAKYAALALGACLLIVVPWQLYTVTAFPQETSIMHAFNQRHFYDALGHPGNVFAHLGYMEDQYHLALICLIPVGMGVMLARQSNQKISASFIFLSWILILFFSFFVKTKMPSYTYPVVALLTILVASALVFGLQGISSKLNFSKLFQKCVLIATVMLFGFLAFRPHYIADFRTSNNLSRNRNIENASLYERIEKEIPKGRTILNCRSYQNINLMFHSDVLAYHYYPTESVIDSLQKAGHRFAAFDYACDHQELPTYIMNDTAIVILSESAK